METMEEETMLEKERPKRSGRLFIAYTVLFTVMMLLVFGRFLYYGKSFIGGADGLSQVVHPCTIMVIFTGSCLQTGSMEIFLFRCGTYP